MKTSPIQLLQTLFQHVRVEIDPRHLPTEIPNPLTSSFTFDGVSIQTEFGIGEADPDHEQGCVYAISLRVVVDNEPNPEAKNQRYSPYRLDVAVDGLVLVPEGAEQLAPRQDLAAVNGASLLWSVIREQVVAVTSRMRAGPVLLPTVHFHDLKQELKGDPGAAVAADAPAPKPARKRAAPRA